MTVAQLVVAGVALLAAVVGLTSAVWWLADTAGGAVA